MKIISWTESARESHDEFLEGVLVYSQAKTVEARDDVQTALARIIRQPGVGRQSEWPGLMRWSLIDWKKIIVYRETPDGIRIIAFYDARQDLSAVHPTPND